MCVNVCVCVCACAVLSIDPAAMGSQCVWAHDGGVALAAGSDLMMVVDLGATYTIDSIGFLGWNHNHFKGTEYHSDTVKFSVCTDLKRTNTCTQCASDLDLVRPRSQVWMERDCGGLEGRYIRFDRPGPQGGNWHFCRVAAHGALKSCRSGFDVVETNHPIVHPPADLFWRHK